MPNLALKKKQNLSAFRRLAIGTWKTAYDPSVYGSLSLRVDKAEAYIEEFREKTGRRLTFTHMMAKAVGHVLATNPDANAILRFNTLYLREQVRVFFQVVMKDPETGEIDLSGVTVDEPQDKDLHAIINEFEGSVKTVRSGKGESEKTRGLFKVIPSLLLNAFVNLIGFLSFALNFDLRWMNVPRDPFGSAMVTNIGSLGLQEAYVPLVPYSYVPLLLAVGAVCDTAVVEDKKIVPGRTLEICATFDHRVLDGAHVARMATTLRDFFEDPYTHFGPIEAAPAKAEEAAPEVAGGEAA